MLTIYIHVDDIIYIASSQYLIDELKVLMMSQFDMIDLCIIKVYQGDHGIFISENQYMLDMFKNFNT